MYLPVVDAIIIYLKDNYNFNKKVKENPDKPLHNFITLKFTNLQQTYLRTLAYNAPLMQLN